MNKPPAFQFYPKDFLSDLNVAIMTMEERGIYITLLSHLWLEGKLPNDSRVLQGLCNHPHDHDEKWNQIWSKVGCCFYIKKSNLHHKRLDQERKKQIEWREKSSLGGQKGARKRWGDSPGGDKGGYATPKRVVEPIDNTSSPSSSSSSSSRDKEKDILKDVLVSDTDRELVQLLIDMMQENNPESHIIKRLTEKRQMEWLNSCRLMRERDNRTPEQIEILIKFSQTDSFWKANILSFPKLREKQDQLILKYKRHHQTQDGIAQWLEGEIRKDGHGS